MYTFFGYFDVQWPGPKIILGIFDRLAHLKTDNSSDKNAVFLVMLLRSNVQTRLVGGLRPPKYQSINQASQIFGKTKNVKNHRLGGFVFTFFQGKCQDVDDQVMHMTVDKQSCGLRHQQAFCSMPVCTRVVTRMLTAV